MMMKVALGSLAAALGLASVSAINLSTTISTSTSPSSRIYVHIPFKIHNPFGFEHVQAEFGFQQHSTTTSGDIAEYLYWINDELCSPLMFNKTKQGYPAHTDGYQTPFILMANDGSCSAVTKARHAQQVGASALVISSSYCYCSDKGCVDKYPNQTTCLEHEPVLVNDGSANDISIPSFLIFKDLAETLKDELKSKNQPVLMELVWGIPPEVKDDDTDTDSIPLDYHLWTTAYDPLVDLETYSNLKTVVDALQGKAHFSPRYRLMDGTRFACDANPDNPCAQLCTNHGRYCTTHARDLSGHAIVKETLRRLCIWKHYQTQPPQQQVNDKHHTPQPSQVWWDYVLYHKEHCGIDPRKFASQDCIHDAMTASKADASIIDQCMTDSGDVETDVPNSLLDHQLHAQKTSGIVSIPSMTINGKALDHTSTWSLFESICREYWLSPVPTPKTCLTCATCPNVIGCLQQGHCVAFSDENKEPHKKSTGGGSNSSKKHHWGKVFFLFLFGLIGYGAYRRYQQMQEYSGGDRPSLNEYFALSSDA
jgi:hypothetical protein